MRILWIRFEQTLKISTDSSGFGHLVKSGTGNDHQHKKYHAICICLIRLLSSIEFKSRVYCTWVQLSWTLGNKRLHFIPLNLIWNCTSKLLPLTHFLMSNLKYYDLICVGAKFCYFWPTWPTTCTNQALGDYEKNACFRLLIWWTGPTNKSRFSFADFDKTWPV